MYRAILSPVISHSMVKAFSTIFLFIFYLSWGTGVVAKPQESNKISDPEIWSLIKNGGKTDKYPDAEAIVIFDRTEVKMEDSGLSHVTHHHLVKIVKRESISKFATLRFDYDPASNYIEIKKVRILRGEKEVIPVDLTKIRDLPQPQRAIFWGARMNLVEVPGLKEGDCLEYLTYRKGFQIAYLTTQGNDERYIPPMRGHFHDVVYFADHFPVVEKRYQLETPKNKPLKFAVYNGQISTSSTFDENYFRYTFSKIQIAPLSREKKMAAYGGDLIAAYSDSVTKVVLTTVPDWQAKSRWFYNVNKTQFEYNQEIQDKVREVTRGFTTDRDKVMALLRWVAHNIRYSGISMGKGEGYTIHTGEMTFNDRSGVCKDIAGMLITMLKAAGYQVFAAMTMAGSRVEEIPADQFNHCVVALKKSDGSFWMLDPTWAPFSRDDWSRAEGEQNYVIGTPEGEKLMCTPAFDPKDNTLKIKAKSVINRKGTLKSEITIQASGYAESRLRYAFAFRPKHKHRKTVEKWLSNIAPQATLEKLKIGDVEDLSRPFKVQIQFQAVDYPLMGEKRYFLVPPLARHLFAHDKRMSDYLHAGNNPKRKYQVMLRGAWYVEFQETLKLPNSWRLKEKKLPQASVEMDNPASSLAFTLNQRGRELKLTEKITIKRRRIMPENYPQFKQVIDKIKQLQNLRLEFVTSGHGRKKY